MKREYVMVGLLALATIVSASGCGGSAQASAEATDVPVVASEADGKVVAEAIIEPARSSESNFALAGDVVAVFVEEGDAVAEGEPLIQLETVDLERAMASTEISLRQAQVRLEKLQDPADDEDLALARAAVSNAAAFYEEAKLGVSVAEHSAEAGENVRAARQERDETYRVYQNLIADGHSHDERKVKFAHDAYLDALGRFNRAVENAQLQVTQAKNGVASAAHALEQARISLDDLLEGADEKDIEAASLDVKAAQLALEQAQSNLAEATLVAPFDGIVATVNVEQGDAVVAGQVVVVLATLDRLQAVTTDLTELDVARVGEGQPAVVTVDALPDEAFAGVVREIALQPGDYRGDVVYAVTVELTDAGDAPLRWGMTALVEIEAE